jgi:hypothetical protein
VERLCCLRCNRELEAGQKSVAVYLFAQTVGIRPRQKSAAQRICFCPHSWPWDFHLTVPSTLLLEDDPRLRRVESSTEHCGMGDMDIPVPLEPALPVVGFKLSRLFSVQAQTALRSSLLSCALRWISLYPRSGISPLCN